jgi:hypothetical protein
MGIKTPYDTGPSLMTYQRICNQINTTSTTSGAGTAYLSRALEFTPGF